MELLFRLIITILTGINTAMVTLMSTDIRTDTPMGISTAMNTAIGTATSTDMNTVMPMNMVIPTDTSTGKFSPIAVGIGMIFTILDTTR